MIKIRINHQVGSKYQGPIISVYSDKTGEKATIVPKNISLDSRYLEFKDDLAVSLITAVEVLKEGEKGYDNK